VAQRSCPAPVEVDGWAASCTRLRSNPGRRERAAAAAWTEARQEWPRRATTKCTTGCGRSTPPRAMSHDDGLRCHATWSDSRRSATPSTGPSRCGERQDREILEPGLGCGRAGGWVAARAASRWVRIWGMTCSVLPTPDCQPHWQLARRWPLWARAAGATVTLWPVTCSLTEIVTRHLRSVGMAKPTRLGARHQLARLDSEQVVRRDRLGHRKAGAPTDRRAHRCAPAGSWWSPTSMGDGRSVVRR
jgi:hypothetical protein